MFLSIRRVPVKVPMIFGPNISGSFRVTSTITDTSVDNRLFTDGGMVVEWVREWTKTNNQLDDGDIRRRIIFDASKYNALYSGTNFLLPLVSARAIVSY